MLGRAAVTIWCDVAPAARGEFDDWHAHEHMPERLSIPGFLRGSRWAAGDGAYFVLYEARDEAVLTSGPYLERLNNPTPWSRKMMPEHRNMVRSVCDVRHSSGAGLGEALLTVRFSARPGAEERLQTALAERLPGLASRKGLVAAHLLRGIPSPMTAEQRIRGADAAADWVVLVAGYDAAALCAVAEGELGPAALAARGAAEEVFGRVYRVACLMTPGDVRPSGAGARPVRRLVTGHGPDGRSTVLFDGPAPNVKRREAGNASTLLWVTEESPADLSGAADRAAREIAVPPPRRGTIFRVAEFPPHSGGEVRDNAAVLRDFGIGPDVARGHPPRHPAIHRTRSLDYVVVLEGEIDLLLDDGDVRLAAGDVVVQRGTNHAWINRGPAVCRLGMVFIDADEPPEIEGLP